MQKISYPLTATLKITNQCNLSCIHCIASSGKKSKNELSKKEIFKIIDELDINHVFSLDINGGECFMRPDIYEIIEYCTYKNFDTCISTNGTLITAQCAEFLKKCNVKLAKVSLDSADEKIHNQIRGTKDAFSNAISGIKNLVKVEIPVVLQTAISRKNASGLKKLVSLASELGVSGINIFVVVPSGRAQNMQSDILSPDDYFELLKNIHNLKQEFSSINFLTDSPLNYVFEILNGNRATIKNECTCLAGKMGVVIKEEGTVIPCPYFEIPLGNIRHNPKIIKEYWMKSPFLNSLGDAKQLAPECTACKFGSTCFGGCRAAAYYKNGNISSLDPFCWYVKRSEKI